jgi:hypothetical protein
MKYKTWINLSEDAKTIVLDNETRIREIDEELAFQNKILEGQESLI